MNKTCARPGCGKTVYPTEELKCLDKVWHKQCFRCNVCGMVLNMKNYKGFEKSPYCEAHYPKTKATIVSDTPEMRRLAENTKIQSQAKYHEEFEKMKGKKTDIPDDPEVLRHVRNMQTASNVAYHSQDAAQDGNYHHSSMPAMPPQPLAMINQMGNPNAQPSPYTAKLVQMSTTIYSSEQGGRIAPASPQVGSIADYDPMKEHNTGGGYNRKSSGEEICPAKPAAMATPFATMGYVPSLQQHGGGGGQPQMYQQQHHAHQQQQQPQRSAMMPSMSQPPPQQRPMQAPPAAVTVSYRAMYDYTAADSDEVTFVEGDEIVNCQRVDEGWMTGTVKRTGQWGMLPANYVERVH